MTTTEDMLWDHAQLVESQIEDWVDVDDEEFVETPVHYRKASQDNPLRDAGPQIAECAATSLDLATRYSKLGIRRWPLVPDSPLKPNGAFGELTAHEMFIKATKQIGMFLNASVLCADSSTLRDLGKVDDTILGAFDLHKNLRRMPEPPCDQAWEASLELERRAARRSVERTARQTWPPDESWHFDTETLKAAFRFTVIRFTKRQPFLVLKFLVCRETGEPAPPFVRHRTQVLRHLGEKHEYASAKSSLDNSIREINRAFEAVALCKHVARASYEGVHVRSRQKIMRLIVPRE